MNKHTTWPITLVICVFLLITGVLITHETPNEQLENENELLSSGVNTLTKEKNECLDKLSEYYANKHDEYVQVKLEVQSDGMMSQVRLVE